MKLTTKVTKDTKNLSIERKIFWCSQPPRIRQGAGDFLFREGEPGDKMYVLLEGDMNVLLGDLAGETAKPGALLGEMALIDNSLRTASVVAKNAVWRKLISADSIFSCNRRRTSRRT